MSANTTPPRSGDPGRSPAHTGGSVDAQSAHHPPSTLAEFARDLPLLAARIVVEGDCWIWQTTNGRPYDVPRLTLGRKTFTFVHRWLYERWFGPILDGQVVMRSCRDLACVQPQHLRLGTKADAVAHRRKDHGKSS